MSYTNTIEYRIVPSKSYELLRNCAGCGCKTLFHNTNCFRVNANGSKLDVWLIYQCTKCKHTYNLPVYERQRPDSIPKKELLAFQSNSMELAFKYGTDIGFFTRNKAEIAREQMEYTLEQVSTLDISPRLLTQGNKIIIHNDFHIKVRTDKLLAEILNISRNKVQQLLRSEAVTLTENKQESTLEILIHQDVI